MNSSSYNYSVSGGLSDQLIIAAAKNVIVLALGITINYINGMLILTFRKHQVFYVNPRYILFIHLVVNDVIQLTTSASLFVIGYVLYKINASLCCLLISLAIFTTMNTPLNLAVMAVECYVAVCFPLRHAELCTVKRTYILIGCVWTLSSVTVLPEIFILLATDPLWLVYSSIICLRENLYLHPVSVQIRQIVYLMYLIGVWFVLFFTYIKIFVAAQAANSADGKEKKARNTVLLHGFQLLLCMLTYVDPMIKTGLMRLFPKYAEEVRFVWYVFVHILPRFISPIVYGLRDKTFKQYLKKHLSCIIRPVSKLHPNSI
ncbi:odorant receptor 131-2-like [Nematolebias whitei]|uniref:odorant receptor 131-2-like n=1 Tax=Nematolebias whitei TaxID=451745 RepID=UPI001898ABF7|nr:odorant receptor 131-2-like [Nematolebias whitei]